MKQRIGIIGAGLGGLTVGALLTHQGHTVTIFEKEASIGGRALSFTGAELTIDSYLRYLRSNQMALPFSEPDLESIFSNKLLHDYRFDLGFHVIGGGVVSNLHTIFDMIQQPHIDMMETRLAQITSKGYNYPFLSPIDKFRMLPQILQLLTANEKKMKELDAVSMMETIHRYGKGKMKITLEMFSRVITTVNNLHEISTGETFRAQRNLLSGSKAVGYPIQGLHNIYNHLGKYITRNGGTIQTQQPVQQLLIEDKCAYGVSTKDGENTFDIVISNLPVQQLFSISKEKQFPKDYAQMIKDLKGTGSLCAYYALSDIPKELLGKTFVFLKRNIGVDGNDAAGMIDFMMAKPDAQMSPKGSYLVQAYIICTPEEAQNRSMLKTLKVALDEYLRHLIPSYEQHLLWALYPTVWQLDGVAKTINNVKPGITTPVKQLFFVGDCLKAPGIGINCALNSARQLAHHLNNQS